MIRRIVALGGGFSNDPEAPDGRLLEHVILDATVEHETPTRLLE